MCSWRGGFSEKGPMGHNIAHLYFYRILNLAGLGLVSTQMEDHLGTPSVIKNIVGVALTVEH